MKYSFQIVLLLAIILTACAPTATPEPTGTPLPTSTPEPTKTATPQPTFTSTPTKAPRAMFEPDSFETLVVVDGFTISVPFPLEYQANENVILIGDERKSFTVSFASDTYDVAQPLTDVIDTYLAGLESRGWQFSKDEPVDIEVDGAAGIAIDLAGNAERLEFEGQAIAVSPDPKLVLFGLGILITELGIWELSGKPTFEGLLDRINLSD